MKRSKKYIVRSYIYRYNKLKDKLELTTIIDTEVKISLFKELIKNKENKKSNLGGWTSFRVRFFMIIYFFKI